MSVGRLLIIDDEAPIAAVLARIGKSCGFDVSTTTSAEAFKESYAAGSPDVIILDLAIPRVDGIELLRWLGDEGCTATIQIISGFGGKIPESAKLLGEARGLKMGGIVSKPFRVADIRAILTELVPTS
ncbi:MAG TPA: response regulator [Alphaproteobacteria bacterium]|jgi:DNA-binding response OmpR family regulator|nr:response regulator [Alphaproteobacteria bacterium]